MNDSKVPIQSEDQSHRLLKIFGNKHYKNIIGMFFLSFIVGRLVFGIDTFTAFDLGQSLVFPIFATIIPHLICLILLGLIWVTKKRIWKGYYYLNWFIWAIFIAFYLWTNLIVQNNP
jgi:fatty acid desaturase